MCQNDAHIYCTEEQIIPELKAVLTMYREAYRVLGIEGYRFRLSRHEMGKVGEKDKYVDSPRLWVWAEEILKKVLEEENLPFFEAKGEAAFYGPKIDVQLKSVTGREETASTIQLDISSAKRLDLKYVGPDNCDHSPYIIHRAPLGTHERTVAFLLEHYGGAFPTWLSPIQVKVIPIGDRLEYCGTIIERLRGIYVRAEADYSSDSLQKKIRNASLMKVPNLVVVGEREEGNQTVSLRRHGTKEQSSMSLDDLVSFLQKEITERRQRVKD
jgi:threonyl-tRNA synthetase